MIFVTTTIIVATIVCILCYKPILRMIAEQKAIPKLERVLFSESLKNKPCIIAKLHRLTNKRLNDDLLLDYFLKIKGLQVLNINKPMNFWVKIYLKTPTKIKLNYFEQVRFYESFLNFPKLNNNIENIASYQNTETNSINTIPESYSEKITKHIISQRFA